MTMKKKEGDCIEFIKEREKEEARVHVSKIRETNAGRTYLLTTCTSRFVAEAMEILKRNVETKRGESSLCPCNGTPGYVRCER